MGRWQNKYVIGLTGNIGMGKSLVRRMLEHLGAYTLDADGLTHQVMAPNAPAYKPVVELFGKFVLQPDGQIDRARLGAIAFAHADALKELENITHPIIRQAIDTLISRATHKVIVVEAIKLLESDLSGMIDAVWVVDCTPQNQLARLMEKRGLSQLEAQKRITVQNPQADKLAKADVVITNNGTPEETWSQVQAAWNRTTAAPAPQQAATTPQPAAQPVAAPPLPTAAVPQPATASDIALTTRRPMPPDMEKVAALVNQVTGSNLSRTDIMSSFYEKTYLMAESEGQPVGLIAFVVENLVTRVSEFIVRPDVPLGSVGKSLIDAMEKASSELQSEIAFVFIPQDKADQKGVFASCGYADTPMSEVRYPAWREAVNEFKPQNTDLLSKRLRENLVLKPI